MKIVKLKSPITVGDKTLDELKCDFDALTGADMIFCEHEAYRKKGSPVLFPDGDASFRLEVLAKASGIDAGALQTMKAPDFREADRAVFNFLMGSE